MSDAFLDLVLGAGRRSIIVVGTAKNVGKTTAFNALRAAALRRGITGALTSIGRDGEAADALDGAPKPRVRIAAGTIVALPRDLLPRTPAFEILDLGEAGPLGPMVFARALRPAQCEIGGPPSARAMRATLERLRELSGGPTFVDGAIDRIAPLAGGDDAIVVATGGASGTSIAAVAEVARTTIARLTLPARVRVHERADVVTISGALDSRDAQELLNAGRAGATIVVADPTRVTVRGKLLEKLMAAFDLRCERPLRVVACTTSSGAARALDPRELVRAVGAATGLPAFDVVAGLAA